MAGDFHERLTVKGRSGPSDRASGLTIAALLMLLAFALRGRVSYSAILVLMAVAVMALSVPKASLLHPTAIAWLAAGRALRQRSSVFQISAWGRRGAELRRQWQDPE